MHSGRTRHVLYSLYERVRFMTITDSRVNELAAHVWQAQVSARPIPKLTNDEPTMTVDDGYRVQNALRKLYVDNDHRIVGWKAGLTSKAKMVQMGVEAPTVGFLTDRMAVPEGAAIDTAALVHPRVECEVAFVLRSDLPTSNCSPEDVLSATAYVVPAIEIIDSRYEAFKFDLTSVIADNSSSARFVVGGNGTRLDTIDRRTLGVALVKNGEVVQTGASAAVMGDPAAAVAIAANIIGTLGSQLKSGMVVLSGGITAAVAVKPGDVISARLQNLGVVDVRFVSSAQ